MGEVLIYKSNRYCTPYRRPWESRYTERNQKNNEDKRRRPFADNIDTFRQVLFGDTWCGRKI